MRKMKKVLNVAISTIMVATILTGCAGKKDSATSQTPDSTKPTEKVEQGGKKEEQGEQKKELDLTKKPVLKVLLPYIGVEPETDLTAIYLEEATGYTVEYYMLPAEDSLTKLNTIIASKEDYDIMVLTKNDFDNTVDTGAYQPLNDLLDQYAPNVLDKTAEGLWTNVTIGGEVKGIPEGLANENYGLVYRVRMDLLKKVGIDKMPETPDEFYNATKALKDQLGIIPITASAAVIPEIASAFGMYSGASNKFSVVGDQVLYQALVPGAKDYVEFMSKLFEEGLLDNEYAQNNGEMMKEKFFSGRAAMYQTAWWSEPTAYNTIMEKAPEAELAYLQGLKGADGSSGLPMGRGINRITVIPKVSKNKEYALDYINTKLNDDIYKMASIGEENVHYKVVGDSYEPILPKFFDDKNNAHYFQMGSDTATYSKYWESTRVKKDPILFAEFNAIQETAAKSTLYYDPTSYMQPNVEYAKLIGKVNQLCEDGFKQFITGTRPMSDWDNFIQELNDTGLESIQKIVNEWWAVEGTNLKDKMVKK